MLEFRADPELQRVIDGAIDAVLNRFYNPDYCLNNELLNHDFTRPTGDLARFIYTGHSIETLWMLADEAVRRGDRQMLETAAARFRRHVEVAWDDVYGGVFRGSSDIEQNQWVLDKVLWAQERWSSRPAVLGKPDAPWARMFSRNPTTSCRSITRWQARFRYWIIPPIARSLSKSTLTGSRLSPSSHLMLNLARHKTIDRQGRIELVIRDFKERIDEFGVNPLIWTPPS
jgi:hypothetical protein